MYRIVEKQKIAEAISPETKCSMNYWQNRKEASVSKVDEIKEAIKALPEEEYVRLRQWFSEKDWQKWDRQIEEDSEAGKLDFLIREALRI